MSKVIKLKQDIEVQSGPSLETEGFLSFEDFWQGSPAAKAVEKPRSPREIAMEEAAEILRQAGDQAENIKQEAWAKGEAEGKAAGLAKYEKKLAELAALFSALDRERDEVLRQHEESMFALITTMVDRLVYHEVSVNPLIIRACLKAAMEFVVENSTVQVHLHGDDLARLEKVEQDQPRLFSGNSKLQFIEDHDVAPGGCFLKTDFGEIDATLDTSKARLYAAVEQAFLAALHGGNTGDEDEEVPVS